MSGSCLIRNGEVHDGSGAPAVRADVRVRDGIITEIAPRLGEVGEPVLDVAGLLVTPGLIDLHVHIYSGMGQWALDPCEAGLRTGVTTLLDAGTAGALTYLAASRALLTPSSVAFCLEHNDGLRATRLLLRGHLQDFCLALRLGGDSTARAACSAIGANGVQDFYAHFAVLNRVVEEFFLSGQSPVPPERTLLMTLTIVTCMAALHRPGERIVTPHLNITYRTPLCPPAARLAAKV